MKEGWIFKGLLLAYFGSILAALLVVLPLDWLNQDPDLPHVMITISDTTKGEGNTAPGDGQITVEDGLLLSHSDGYWDVIDTSSRDRHASIGKESFLVTPGKDVEDVKVYEDPVEKADLDIVDIDLGDAEWVGEKFTYAVEVHNRGPYKATDIRLDNYVPEGMRFDSAVRDGDALECRPGESEKGPKYTDQPCDLGEPLTRDESARVNVVVEPVTDKPSADKRYSFKADVISDEVDPDGDDKTTAEKQLKVDMKAPTIDASIVTDDRAYQQGTWTNKDVTVNLTAIDKGGSGLNRFAYRKGKKVHSYDSLQQAKAKSVVSYSAVFDVTSEGSTDIAYSAKDVAGNTKASDGALTIRLDKTKPELRHLDKITKEATSSGGAEVNYKVTATDEHPDNPKPNCSPAPGSMFSLGKTKVRCSATDEAHNKAKGSFKVEIQDTKKPNISDMPSDITKEATGPDGAKVSWDEPTATDRVDGRVKVKCDPPSGTTFPPGEKTVTCISSDIRENKRTKAFKVNVIYGFEGFLAPLDEPSTLYGFSAGDAVLVDFDLGGYYGDNIFAKGYPKTREIDCNSAGAVSPIQPTNLRHTNRAEHYTYAWNTEEAWVKTRPCLQLLLKLKDGTRHSLDFEFIR